jgi:hypothetical protein
MEEEPGIDVVEEERGIDVEEERDIGVEAHTEDVEEGMRWRVNVEEGAWWRVDTKEERVLAGVGEMTGL